jgi:hypothetical protein
VSDSAASDVVWNRATRLIERGPGTPPGDAALAALLLFHSLAMNGGVLHAHEGLSADQLARAVAGYRFFGLTETADLVEQVARRAADLDPDDFDAAEALELEGDERYNALVPRDETVVAAFEAHFRDHPEDYAPVGS